MLQIAIVCANKQTQQWFCFFSTAQSLCNVDTAHVKALVSTSLRLREHGFGINLSNPAQNVLASTASNLYDPPEENRMLRATLVFLLTLASATAQTRVVTKLDPANAARVKLVEQIKRSDYEGDRAALKRLHDELHAPQDKMVASRVDYWRGFALWRRAINGFNDSPLPKDLEEDLHGAIADFDHSLASDPSFVESKIAEGSCYGYLMFLNMGDSAKMQEFLQHSSPLLKDAMATGPDNPRLLWVLGPIRWSSPPERGGGQDKAFDLYNRGLEIIRKKPAATDPLEPSWGEPELLMNRAWSNLNSATPT